VYDADEPESARDGSMAWPGESALQRAGLAFEIVVAYHTSPRERLCADCGALTDHTPMRYHRPIPVEELLGWFGAREAATRTPAAIDVAPIQIAATRSSLDWAAEA
jgi:hypothetical protein